VVLGYLTVTQGVLLVAGDDYRSTPHPTEGCCRSETELPDLSGDPLANLVLLGIGPHASRLKEGLVETPSGFSSVKISSARVRRIT